MPETERKNQQAIGLFDSGVGGLTVLTEVWKQLPGEAVIYLADNARLPYGSKTRDEILKFNLEIHRFLQAKGCKLVIMACNTSSSLALTTMQAHFPMPIVGLVEPGAQAAVAVTRNHQIGVIATEATIQSDSYQEAIRQLNPNTQVFGQSCPLFVPLIEGGFLTTEETKRVAQEYLRPLQAEQIDTLILGCTHYPHLAKVIQEILGKSVTLVDPAHATVHAAQQILKEESLLRTANPLTPRDCTHFYVTHAIGTFQDLAQILLGHPIPPPQLTQL